jgi:hypothetical protein
LKNQIQKWESFSTTQKQKSNFQAVLHFFICEAIIAQPSCFVNRYRKFFHAYLHKPAILPFADAKTATFTLTQSCSQPYTSTHNLTILRVFVDGLVG